MRHHVRLLLLCTVLLCAALATTAAADRDEKPDKAGKAAEKAERADKAEKAEKAEKDTSTPPVGELADQIEQPGEVKHPENTVFGHSIAAEPHAGTITVQVPGSDEFRMLAPGEAIPVGSYVDASRGLVEIGAEASPRGAEQNAVVTGSVFRVGQEEASGLTVLALKGGDFSDCDDEDAAGPRARSAGRRKGSGDVARGIWAAGKGRFRTKGRHGAATVRGTRWATVDRCHSTTVKVFEGIVDVSDFGLGRSVAVAAGERYVARERHG